MAKVKVIVAPSATRTLKNIMEYKKQFTTIKSVRTFRKKIFIKIKLLESAPRLGIYDEDLSDEDMEYRYLIAEKCRIIYRVETNTQLRVTAIIDTRTLK